CRRRSTPSGRHCSTATSCRSRMHSSRPATRRPASSGQTSPARRSTADDQALTMRTLLFLDDWPLHHREHLERRAGVPTWVPEATLEDEIVDGTWNFPFVFHDVEVGVWKALYPGVSFKASDTGNTRQFLGLLYAESPDGIHWQK